MQVYRDLIAAAARNKDVNTIRYMLALRQIERADGSVAVDNAVVTLSCMFAVKPKTVLNRLHIAVSRGYGNFNPSGTRFYYYSQERMLAAMGESLTSRISVNIQDFSGTVVQARAMFHAALLASRGTNPTITRATIKNWSGRSRRSQRNYEKIANIGRKANYARLTEYTQPYDLDRIRWMGYPAFVKLFPDGTHYITKQLANTYFPPNNFIRSKRTTQPGIIVGSGNALSRVYWQDVGRGLREWTKQGGDSDIYIWNERADAWEWIIKTSLP